jgi:putative transposase
MTERKRRRHSPEQIVKKLRDADAMLNSGKDLSAVLQSLGIAEVTFHRRSNEFGRNEIELSQTAEGT